MALFDVYSVYDIDIVKAQDMTLLSSKGTSYLDMYGGHAVISIGHTNPYYVDKMCKQLNNISFYSNSIKIPKQDEYSEKLGLISGKKDYSLFLCNSGAEANENAIKLASFHNNEKKIIAFSGSFHGRTSMAVALTDDPTIVAPVNQTENCVILPYNSEERLKSEFAKGGVSAVIIEAIQGVGGVIMANESFLKLIRSLCDEHNAVLISDCVQSGCGRSGRYFAMDHSGVDADIYSMAKGIGNGFPMGAILISPKIVAKKGMLGTTFGGSYMACEAGCAVVDEMNTRSLIENAEKMGSYLIGELKSLCGEQIIEVRGVGLMIGIVFKEDCSAIRSKLLFEENIFVGNAKDKRIVRLLPSLTITKEACDQFLNSFKKIING